MFLDGLLEELKSWPVCYEKPEFIRVCDICCQILEEHNACATCVIRLDYMEQFCMWNEDRRNDPDLDRITGTVTEVANRLKELAPLNARQECVRRVSEELHRLSVDHSNNGEYLYCYRKWTPEASAEEIALYAREYEDFFNRFKEEMLSRGFVIEDCNPKSLTLSLKQHRINSTIRRVENNKAKCWIGSWFGINSPDDQEYRSIEEIAAKVEDLYRVICVECELDLSDENSNE